MLVSAPETTGAGSIWLELGLYGGSRAYLPGAGIIWLEPGVFAWSRAYLAGAGRFWLEPGVFAWSRAFLAGAGLPNFDFRGNTCEGNNENKWAQTVHWVQYIVYTGTAQKPDILYSVQCMSSYSTVCRSVPAATVHDRLGFYADIQITFGAR